MSPAELQELRERTVTDPETAIRALGCGRTLGYRLLREHGELAEGVKAIRVGRTWKIPTRPLLVALGYEVAE